MLNLGSDSGTLRSETGIHSKTIKKAEPVDSAHGEMHMPRSVSVILRRDTKCHISPTQFCGSECQLAGGLMKCKRLEHWGRTQKL